MKIEKLAILLLAAGLLTATGCKDKSNQASSGSGEQGSAAGANTVKIDGSSTVYPISQAVAEEFQKQNDARVTIGVSGSGGGFKKFCRGETDISDASRPIKPVEVKKCQENGIEYVEVPVAYDGISVIVNSANDWVDSMTVAELKKLWEPAAQGKVTKWNQIREGWPDHKINLNGPGTDSGTYDYFTHAIVGTEHSSRGDYSPNADANVIAKAVANDKYALGFLGFAYFDENRDTLHAAAIKNDGGEPVEPSVETIADGTYQPLSRPVFIYIKKSSLENKKAVSDFVDYYLTQGAPLVKEVGYVPLPRDAYELAQKRVAERTTGSVFGGEGSKIGVTVQELLSTEEKAVGADKAGSAGDEVDQAKKQGDEAAAKTTEKAKSAAEASDGANGAAE